MKEINRRNFFRQSLAVGVTSFVTINLLELLASCSHGDLFPDEMMDKNNIIPAPGDPAQWQIWRERLHEWKRNKKVELSYDGNSYRSEPFEWVTSNFSCGFIMMCDSEFYDHQKNEYTIDNLIEQGKQKYGGYDSIVLWHAYPRIGLDERNQFDFYREMPHGLEGVQIVVSQLHRAGVKVFINYNPWDTGTRREGRFDIDVLIDIIKYIDADGVFLDTMKEADGFRVKLDGIKPGVVMESELALPLEHVERHHLSWAQEFKDSEVPGVYRNKWFEHRHIQHAIHRWSNDKTPQLQTAWMNGSGIMIWENIFGQWIGWSERDKAIYRAMYAIQHQYHELFSGDGWIPLSQESPVTRVYISLWEKDGIRLWTLINRNEYPVSGILMKTAPKKGDRCFDLLKGEELLVDNENEDLSFYGDICSRGIACFLSIPGTKTSLGFDKFLNGQKENYQTFTEDTTIPLKTNRLINRREIAKHSVPLKGMVQVPATKLEFKVEYTLREVGAYYNVQDYIAISASHKQFMPHQISKEVEIGKFGIDETPVTNSQFKEFIDDSGYNPLIPENFLKHWENGQIPPGKENHPVVYVGLEDARAYAKWSGKRLPTEFEWQLAAQGNDGLDYPWGNEMQDNRCNQNADGKTTSVKAFPNGVSPFGCYDMCGNTWELTESEHSDGRSRFVMLKGGSCFKAVGSHWYMDGGPQKNNFLAKMLLIWAGLDRCSTVGFRCAVDLKA